MQPGPSARFSSVSAPPWPSAICRLSTKPMPEPPGLVVKNGTNRLAVLGQARAFVRHPDLQHGAVAPPADRAPGRSGGQRGVGGVAQQVDEHLLELIGVAVHGHLRPRLHSTGTRVSKLTARRTSGADLQRLQLRAGQLGQPRIGADEPAEALANAR